MGARSLPRLSAEQEDGDAGVALIGADEIVGASNERKIFVAAVVLGIVGLGA
jgi:hypothetical protein